MSVLGNQERNKKKSQELNEKEHTTHNLWDKMKANLKGAQINNLTFQYNILEHKSKVDPKTMNGKKEAISR